MAAWTARRATFPSSSSKTPSSASLPPYNPAGNLQLSEVPNPLLVDLTTEGGLPRLPRETNGTVRVPAYTDLKRHDMGPELAETTGNPEIDTLFITPRLWGITDTGPYLHDGRADTLARVAHVDGPASHGAMGG